MIIDDEDVHAIGPSATEVNLAPTNDPKLKLAAEVLRNAFRLRHLYLFGSRAKGAATEDSDYDFVVVIDGQNEDQLGNIRRARDLLAAQQIYADVFVYSEAQFEKHRRDFNSICEVAASTGREIDLNGVRRDSAMFYRPVKFGARFSMNARMPSRLSSETNA